MSTFQSRMQWLTCDNSLSVDLIEAGDREADHAAIGILDIRLTSINLTAAVPFVNWTCKWHVSFCLQE